MTLQMMPGLTIHRQLRARQRTTHVPIHRMAKSNGFSLVELMIVAGLTAIVLAGLGALTLVADVQVARRSDSMQEAQEHWSRAVTFIQNEVADAATISKTLIDSYPKDCGTEPDPKLVLYGPNNPTDPAWTVIYGIRSVAEDDKHLYRGPNLLVRCGPLPLAADRDPAKRQLTAIYGNLPNTSPNTSTVPTETILLDRLSANNPLKILPLEFPNNGPVQDAQLTITMKVGTNKDDTEITYPGTPFRVHVQRSP